VFQTWNISENNSARYTPPEVAQLIANIVDPKEGEEIYDPCLGSGGLLIKSARAQISVNKKHEDEKT
jgi:type I restriction enzyme M protein